MFVKNGRLQSLYTANMYGGIKMRYCEALDRLPTKVGSILLLPPLQPKSRILFHRNGSPRYLYIGNDFGVIGTFASFFCSYLYSGPVRL